MEYIYDEYDGKIDNQINKLKNDYAGGFKDEIDDLIKYHQDQMYYLKKSILSSNLNAPVIKKQNGNGDYDQQN